MREGEGGPAVLIAGPTASGKSALAIRIAQAVGGVVINADSMQIYRDLRVLTARPSPADEAAAEHRLYGTVEGAVNFSVGRYLDALAAVLAELDRAGRLPVIVGGTGLYFKAMLEGLSELPAIPDPVRARVREEAEGRPTEALHAALAARDPLTASTLRRSDRLRVMRALEVLEASGRPLAELQGERRPGLLAGRSTVRVFLFPEREALRGAIDARFERMLQEGALDEVAALGARGLDPMLPVMRAHGVPALLRHLRGEIPLAEAVRTGQGDTRAYAKRQFTWFRNQMPGWTWAAPGEGEAAVQALLSAVHP